MVDYNKIQEIINYKFNNIKYLEEAMNKEKLHSLYDGKNRENYKNEALALVGDKLISLILTELVYSTYNDKQYIAEISGILVSNKILVMVRNKHKILECFDDYDPNDEIKHDMFIEAITGAIYLDSNFDTLKSWVKEWLLPKLVEATNEKNDSTKTCINYILKDGDNEISIKNPYHLREPYDKLSSLDFDIFSMFRYCKSRNLSYKELTDFEIEMFITDNKKKKNHGIVCIEDLTEEEFGIMINNALDEIEQGKVIPGEEVLERIKAILDNKTNQE